MYELTKDKKRFKSDGLLPHEAASLIKLSNDAMYEGIVDHKHPCLGSMARAQ